VGSPRRLVALFDGTRRSIAGFFGASPLVAYPAAGVAALAVCGVLVWLVAFQGGSKSTGDVAGVQVSPTTGRTTTATATPGFAPTPVETLVAAESGTLASAGSNEGPAAESSMRFKIPSIGVDAPVTIRSIGSDGQMGAPNGRFDVVWYDFSAFAGMGGYPGEGGNAVFSGHVDYHPNYEAVFWDLRLVGPGDVIEVVLPNGTSVRYSVQWSETISHESEFSSYVTKTGADVITIVTCQGTFDAATHNYNSRLVVRGVRIS